MHWVRRQRYTWFPVCLYVTFLFSRHLPVPWCSSHSIGGCHYYTKKKRAAWPPHIVWPQYKPSRIFLGHNRRPWYSHLSHFCVTSYRAHSIIINSDAFSQAGFTSTWARQYTEGGLWKWCKCNIITVYEIKKHFQCSVANILSCLSGRTCRDSMLRFVYRITVCVGTLWEYRAINMIENA